MRSLSYKTYLAILIASCLVTASIGGWAWHVGVHAGAPVAADEAVNATVRTRPAEVLADAVTSGALGYDMPQGRARVANADDFDAGAGNGHRTPVTVWVEGDTRVAGLRGHVAFGAAPEGLRISWSQLSPVPLMVDSPAAALARLRQARPDIRHPIPANAPFYGLFAIDDGAARYTVNAETGEIEGP